MKISPSEPNNTPPHLIAVKSNSTTSAVPGGAGSPSKQSAEPAAPSDRAQLSNLSNYLASALSGSPAHVAKLSELGTAVSNGQYHVDAYTVSGSIIQHSIELGGSGYLGLST
jgi:anti-sigma28 factor (negative regulator of flagellin synthesis)